MLITLFCVLLVPAVLCADCNMEADDDLEVVMRNILRRPSYININKIRYV